MSQSDERPATAIVRAVYEAFATKEIPRIVSLFSPDFELPQSTEVPWSGVYHGHDVGLATHDRFCVDNPTMLSAREAP